MAFRGRLCSRSSTAGSTSNFYRPTHLIHIFKKFVADDRPRNIVGSSDFTPNPSSSMQATRSIRAHAGRGDGVTFFNVAHSPSGGLFMPRILTVFNCGTAFDENSTDVISKLYSMARAADPSSAIINSGPGSDAETARSPVVECADSVREIAERLPITPAISLSASAVRFLTKFRGDATGYGMRERVRKTMQVFRGLDPTPAVVNMAAWSRGCCTSIMIAHEMIRANRSTPPDINLFFFDPVPGPKRLNCWNWGEYMTSLPDCVRRCSVVFQEDVHEGSATGFLMDSLTPQLLMKWRKPDTVYPLPGLHSSGVESGPKDSEYEYVAALARRLCETFLLESGTPLPVKRLTPHEACELYARIRWSTLRHQIKNRQIRARGDGRQRVLSQAKASAPADTGIYRGTVFVNQDHYERLLDYNPYVAKKLSGASSASCRTDGIGSAKWMREMARLKAHLPMTCTLIAEATHPMLAARFVRPVRI